MNGNWTYGYDDFNRLLTSTKAGGFAYTHDYDRYGNRWHQYLNGACTAGTSFCLAFDTNNRISNGAQSYDTAGNVIADSLHHYFYDAENHLIQVDGTFGTCSTATACYVYDASGQRVRKTTGVTNLDYLYDLAGHPFTEVNSSGAWNRTEVYAGGLHLASYAGGTAGTTYFDHTDWLGTERARSNVSGAVCETITSLPFGDGEATSGSCGDPSPLHFTGKERDSESGLDNFGARYDASSLGRFMTPDWSAKVAPVPYAKLGDPQTLNLYAYVGNNPLSRNDPTGHVLNCVSNQSQCGSDLSKIAPGTKVGADGTVQKGSLLQRIVNHLDGHGDGQALVTRLVNNSAVTGINPNSGDAHGGTAGGHTITYDPGGANGVLVRGADGNITTGHVSGAGILGHELIHEDHAERGVQDFSAVTHTFTDGGHTFGETGRSEEFRTVGFSPFVQHGDITENQLNHEMGQPERATYTFDKNDFIPQP